MYDKGWVIFAITVFLILVTIPLWHNLFSGQGDYQPAPEIATKNVPGKDKCVMPVEYMSSKHMDLLNEWREKVVREGERIHVAPDGKTYNISLSNTCLDCHYNKDKFCESCHNFMGVKPYCWSCHLEPDEKQ